MIAPVLDPIANGTLPSLSPSVLPPVIDHVKLPVSPVAATVTTAALLATDSAMLAELSVTVTASLVTAIVYCVDAWLLSELVALTVTVQDCALS